MIMMIVMIMMIMTIVMIKAMMIMMIMMIVMIKTITIVIKSPESDVLMPGPTPQRFEAQPCAVVTIFYQFYAKFQLNLN